MCVYEDRVCVCVRSYRAGIYKKNGLDLITCPKVGRLDHVIGKSPPIPGRGALV